MATIAKDSSVKKEKKVTSPSNSHTTHTQRSSKPSVQVSTDKDKSNPSQKRVPNYLKPTVSSRVESFKNVSVKKNCPNDATAKATLLRRRSFDKPPSSSRVEKALISPGPRERTIPIRSSISPKTSSSPKPSLDKAAKTPPKAGKPQLLGSKSIKKSIIPTIKKETAGASASTKDPRSQLNLETKHEDKDCVVHEVEEIVKVESEVEGPSETPKSENVDAVYTEVNNHEDEKLKTCDISTVSEDQNVSQAAQIEEVEDKLDEEKTDCTQHEGEENHIKEESDHSEERFAEEAKIEAEDHKGEENATDKDASIEETGDENKVEDKVLDEKEQGSEGSQEIKPKEEQEVVESGVEETKKKPEAANVVSKRQGGQGKKDSPAYNDVIEETASKLLEKRKNKVKALVGAFETVIDYEASSK